MVFSTKRMTLREWDEKDAPFLYKLNLDSEVIKYTGDPAFVSVDDALELIKNYTDYKEHGYGRWICELKSTGESIGWAGLKNQMKDEGIIDVGYRFLREHWNKGYGTEAAAGCLKVGFEKFQMEKITGRAAIDNIHSHAILKRIGLIEEFGKKDCQGIEALYYSISKLEYETFSK